MRLWPVILWLSLAVSAGAQHSRVPARAVDVGSWLSYTNIRTGTNTLDRFLQCIDANWENLRGPTGPAGADGADGAGVEIVILNDYGTNDEAHVWGLNFGLADATWLNEVIFAVPRGPAGPAGVDGLDGADGPEGPMGTITNDGVALGWLLLGASNASPELLTGVVTSAIPEDIGFTSISNVASEYAVRATLDQFGLQEVVDVDPVLFSDGHNSILPFGAYPYFWFTHEFMQANRMYVSPDYFGGGDAVPVDDGSAAWLQVQSGLSTDWLRLGSSNDPAGSQHIVTSISTNIRGVSSNLITDAAVSNALEALTLQLIAGTATNIAVNGVTGTVANGIAAVTIEAGGGGATGATNYAAWVSSLAWREVSGVYTSGSSCAVLAAAVTDYGQPWSILFTCTNEQQIARLAAPASGAPLDATQAVVRASWWARDIDDVLHVWPSWSVGTTNTLTASATNAVQVTTWTNAAGSGSWFLDARVTGNDGSGKTALPKLEVIWQ